jgi:hypothetical protein
MRHVRLPTALHQEQVVRRMRQSVERASSRQAQATRYVSRGRTVPARQRRGPVALAALARNCVKSGVFAETLRGPPSHNFSRQFSPRFHRSWFGFHCLCFVLSPPHECPDRLTTIPTS